MTIKIVTKRITISYNQEKKKKEDLEDQDQNHNKEDCQQLQPRGNKLEVLELEAIQFETYISNITIA